MGIYQTCDIRGDAAKELTPQLYRRWGLRRLAGRWPHVTSSSWAATAALDRRFFGRIDRRSVRSGSRRGRPGNPAYADDLLRQTSFAGGGIRHCNGFVSRGADQWVAVDDRPAFPNVQRHRHAAMQSGVGREMKSESYEPAPKVDGGASAMVALAVPHVENARRFLRLCCQSPGETFADALGAERHVVLDPMCGCWAGRVRATRTRFSRAACSLLSGRRHPGLGGRSPDCSHVDELHELCDAVYRERAHVGFAFDGDGDRLAVVDNEGVVLSTDETTWLLLQSLELELRGQTFVHDMRLSDRIIEAAQHLVAQPLAERSGVTRIGDRMRESGALGVESGGHYFYRMWPPATTACSPPAG